MSKLGWHSLGTSFECACGVTHNLPIKVCHMGIDAAEQLAAYARMHLGGTCLVVSDENTRHVGGEDVLSALSGAGKQVTEKIFGADPIDAAQELGEEVCDAAAEADFIVAVGAGTLSDLVKYAGDKLARPVLLYPTAASMNGYTSGIVALKVRGLKRTLPCAPAEAVFANPEVCATAPQRMTASGLADFLSKCSSSTDWRAAHHLRGGYFCERPREFFEGVQDRLLAAAQWSGRGDAKHDAVILEALLLSGCSMVIAGSSAPASGGEHLISHFLDMKSALYGTSHDLHGTQVGVATVHCLKLWEQILELDPAAVDVDACIDAQPSEDTVEQAIREDWGDAVGDEVLAQWREKRLTPEALRAEIVQFKETLPLLREECWKDLLPSATVADAITQAGGPVQPEDLEAPLEEYTRALTWARYIRNRFTVLDLAAELGLTTPSCAGPS